VIWFSCVAAGDVLLVCRSSVSDPTNHFWWAMNFKRNTSAH